jgi:RNA polymerase sigma factor (sigma-70 family)
VSGVTSTPLAAENRRTEHGLEEGRVSNAAQNGHRSPSPRKADAAKAPDDAPNAAAGGDHHECDAARAAAPRDDTSHAALLVALADDSRASALFSKVSFIARARYGIRPQDAEDIFQDSIVTYLAIYGRYPPGDNHFGILVGIFHKKSLEFLDSEDRHGRVARRFVARLQADRPVVARGEDPCGPAADRVVRDEDAALIRSAISTLSDDARELLLALAEGRMSRLDMIQALGINRNTFDTRLRNVRMRLKRVLAESGVL